MIQLSAFNWRNTNICLYMLLFSSLKRIVHAFHFHKEKYTAVGSFHNANIKQAIHLSFDSNVFFMIRCQLILDLSFKGVQSIWCWFLAVHPQLFSGWDRLQYTHLSIHWKWILTDITLYCCCRWFPCYTSTHIALDSGVR